MRRTHRKVRTGCSECRRRRVKCDEKKPQCQNCIRNDLQCSLLFLTPKAAFPSRILCTSTSQTYRPTTSPFKTILLPAPNPSLNPLSLPSASRELLHHYTTTVYLTVANLKAADIWRTEIPRMGLHHPFLMHGTLAISALHLSLSLPGRAHELSEAAAKEEQLALPTFRELVARGAKGDIHAVFGFSGLVFIYILASALTDGATIARLPTRGDPNPHWFLALGGLIPLLGANYDILKQGPFGPVLLDRQEIPDLSVNPSDHQLASLSTLFREDAITTSSPAALAACRDALISLRRVFCLPYTENKSWLNIKSGVYIWPGVVSQDFLESLFDRIPEALILLAHYCVLVKNLNSCWYFRGLGVGLLERIEEELAMEWWPWIEWAKEQPVA